MLNDYKSGKKREWSWRQGPVDPDGEHIELRYGDASKAAYEQWIPAALVGKPIRCVFPVRWVLEPPFLKWEIIKAVIGELNFYLVEKLEPDPWGYAQYHCNTCANMYSRVHWSYFPSGQQGKRLSSMVVRLSAEEAAQLFPREARQPDEPEGK